MDDIKTEKKIIPKTYRQFTTNTNKIMKKHIINYKNKDLYIKNNSSNNLKFNSATNKTKANKSLRYNNNSNNKKINNSFYDILNKRQSCRIPDKKKYDLITHKRITLKRTPKKNMLDNNLTIDKLISNNNIENKNINEKFPLHNSNKFPKGNQNNKSDLKKEKNIKEKNNIIRGSRINYYNKKIIYEKLNLDIDMKEKKDENEIMNKVLRHNTTVFTLEKNNLLFENNKSIDNNKPLKIQSDNAEHDLDKFFRQNDKNKKSFNSDLFRFSNISKINNNDLNYLNNNINFTENRNNSIFINPKIETIEGNESHELFDYEEKILEEIVNNEDKQKNKNMLENELNQIVYLPCLNCDKLINIDEMDEHSNKCFNIKNNNIDIKNNNDNYINIIENKLNNILEYLNKIQENKNHNIIHQFKLIIKDILSSKEINSYSIDNLYNIKTKINNLMKNNLYDDNIFTLLSRAKILLEEKIKYFSDINKKNRIENSEMISESETTEFFDLKKMEKILDEKEAKIQNLDKIINEAKNKRLFLMEVLKVKYQKIKENKNEDLIQPEMIWKEALKKNIPMNNWTQFIFNELNNPYKYIKTIPKKNNNIYQKRK